VFHGVTTMEQWKKLRFDELTGSPRSERGWRGISCHNPEVLRAAIPSGLCDVVMFPVGPFVDDRYVTEILPLARQHNVGTVCFKTFGAGKLLGDTEGYQRPLASRPRGKLSSGGSDAGTPTLPRLSVEECLHYTLTLDPDVTLLGLSFPNEQDAAFAAAEKFRPFTPTEMADVKRCACEAIRDKGRVWWNPATAE
jgi:1-deoxyxylulose-5-phosphate synthase